MEYNEGLGSIRTKKAPKKTIKAYKLMRLVDGKLYPLFIDSSVPTEIGVWYDADSTSLDSLRDKEAGFYYLMSNEGDVIRKQAKKPTKTEVEDVTKMGLRYMYVKQAESKQRRYGGYKQYYNVGINGSGVVSPTYAIRPGWHAGSLPTMRQIGKGSNKDKRDDSFVWTEVELSADVDYNPEAQRNPDKDIPDHIPEDGYYMKATNADKKKSQADLVGWYVAGAMKINRIICDKEARQIIDRFNAKHPGQKKVEYDYERESGKEFDAGKMMLEGISSVLSGLGMSVHHNSPYLLKRADGSFIDPETGERLGFDHRFMSSGEGHQVHGWGSYFSVKDLKKYADVDGGVRYKDVQFDEIESVFKNPALVIAIQYVMSFMKKGDTAKKGIEKSLEIWNDNAKNNRRSRMVVDELKSLDPYDFVTNKRHHYHVEIPDNDGIIYLEEEEPLKEEQIEMIKSQARKENKKDIVNLMSYAESNPYKFSLFRSDIVDHSNSRDNMTPEEFSKFLSRAGFVGIHYYGNLDGECYVIFDENDAKIVGHDLFGVSGIDEDFADKLNYFIENGYSLGNRYDYFSCGYANDILQACGLKSDIEIVITQSGMKKILGKKVGKKDNAHDLTPIEVLRLPQLIQKPILVINGNTSDTRLIFVEIPRRGRKMFAVVDLDINLFLGKQGKYNLIASVYSQENHKVVEKIVSASVLNNIHYYDSTKIKSWLSEAGQLQLLPTITTNSLYSEKDFQTVANIQQNSEKTKNPIGNTETTTITTSQQFQNRRQARASKLKKGDNITYTEDDFFRVDCKDLNRAHETIMYWMDKIGSKKSLPWLEDLLLDADGYPIYTNLYNAESFIEIYNLYNDEWKKDFIYGGYSAMDWVRDNHYGGDDKLLEIIMKLHHKPSVLSIYEAVKNAIVSHDDDEVYVKYAKSYLEKIKKHSDSIKDKELIDNMVNAHKRAFSDKVTTPKVTLSDCYKYCNVDKLPNGDYERPSYAGIYHDPRGFAVVTDGKLVYAHKNLYEEKHNGNIVDKSGNVINGKFPNWQQVVNDSKERSHPISIDRDDLYKKLCMYERKYKYRRHHSPYKPFAIIDGDKTYYFDAFELKGFVFMSYAHKDVKFSLYPMTDRDRKEIDGVAYLLVESNDCSVGVISPSTINSTINEEGNVEEYGLIEDTYTDGYPFLLDSVYRGIQETIKPNNLQFAKAKMKMAAARIKLMKM